MESARSGFRVWQLQCETEAKCLRQWDESGIRLLAGAWYGRDVAVEYFGGPEGATGVGGGAAGGGRGENISLRDSTLRLVAGAIAAGVCALSGFAADVGLAAPAALVASGDANVVGGAQARPSRPGDANSSGFDMSASDVGQRLARLLLDKPEVPITPPMEMDKPGASAPLPAEGTMLVDRLCRLWSERNSFWLVLTFEPEPGRAAGQSAPADDIERRLLPCELMEQMETLAARRPGTRFRVSGETTTFEGRAYLLPTKVTVLPHEAPSALPAVAPALAGAPAPKPAAGATSAPLAGPGPASAPAGRDKPGELTSDDLLKVLLSENAGRPIQTVPVLPDSPKPASVAPTNPAVLAVARGEMVADRLVRIVPDPQGRWWIAAFEADNTLQEPPMRLLPCEMLAKAKALAGEARPGRMRVFRVSGKVTRYEGDRYLLLRKVLVELNLGQF